MTRSPSVELIPDCPTQLDTGGPERRVTLVACSSVQVFVRSSVGLFRLFVGRRPGMILDLTSSGWWRPERTVSFTDAQIERAPRPSADVEAGPSGTSFSTRRSPPPLTGFDWTRAGARFQRLAGTVPSERRPP